MRSQPRSSIAIRWTVILRNRRNCRSAKPLATFCAWFARMYFGHLLSMRMRYLRRVVKPPNMPHGVGIHRSPLLWKIYRTANWTFTAGRRS